MYKKSQLFMVQISSLWTKDGFSIRNTDTLFYLQYLQGIQAIESVFENKLNVVIRQRPLNRIIELYVNILHTQIDRKE